MSREPIEKQIQNLADPMRIFPVLNKFDRIWSAKLDKTFCEIYNDITKGKNMTDLEFTKAMEDYIDGNKIK